MNARRRAFVALSTPVLLLPATLSPAHADAEYAAAVR
jgi:hypothetical protein